MRYDLCAIARPSLRRDLWVLFATAKTVLSGGPLESEAVPGGKAAQRDESIASPFDAQPARAPLPSLDPKFARAAARTASARELDRREGPNNPTERPGARGNGPS